MELKEAIEAAFAFLEKEYNPKWTTGLGSKDNLIKAFSQNTVPKHEFLGYKGSDGIRHSFNRAIPNHNKPKGVLWEHWLLSNIGKFQCTSCSEILSLDLKCAGKNMCKGCDSIRVTSRKEQNQVLVYSILSKASCTDCGISNPIVLEFDHRNPNDKLFNIGESYTKSKEAILAEIDKCDIVCANCHRIRTAKQFNYFSYKMYTSIT